MNHRSHQLYGKQYWTWVDPTILLRSKVIIVLRSKLSMVSQPSYVLDDSLALPFLQRQRMAQMPQWLCRSHHPFANILPQPPNLRSQVETKQVKVTVAHTNASNHYCWKTRSYVQSIRFTQLLGIHIAGTCAVLQCSELNIVRLPNQRVVDLGGDSEPELA